MTTQQEILKDNAYTPLLDHGFVGFIDKMGDDHSIVQAARVSYGKGTKSVRQDRGLIRYLMRHRHTSPFEMIQTKWHIKLPIFVMRQLVRHRTAALNEYSGRYSVMVDEFYIPDPQDIMPQSVDNKQGRGGEISDDDLEQVVTLLQGNKNQTYQLYQLLLGEPETEDWTKAELELSKDFPGIARELARMVLPVNNYTECYWTINLHNLFHFIKLRADSHAQKEIRVYADAMFEECKKHFPLATEAFEDYVMNGATFSHGELMLLNDLLMGKINREWLNNTTQEDAQLYNLTVREIAEFITKMETAKV